VQYLNREECRMHATRILPLLTVFLGLAAQIAAQALEGVVKEEATGAGLPGAEVVLRDAEEGTLIDRAVTDEEGRFMVAFGTHRAVTLTVSRLGYHTFASDPIAVGAGERLSIEIRLGVDAIPIDPLVVTDRSRRYPPDVQAFYDRLERGRRTGDGHYISRAEIEVAFPSRPTDLLRSMAGVRVARGRAGSGELVHMRGGCIPSIYIDGAHINRFDTRLSLDDHVAAGSIEGIEVYRGSGRLVGHMHDPRGCGLILVWTRRGERDATSIPWRTVGVVLVALAALLLLFR
jgi:hypothetical protein